MIVEVPDEVRMRNLKALADSGHEDRILVSHDAVSCFAGGMGSMTPTELRKILPNWEMTHLFENIFPELRRMGMSEASIDTIMVDNPRRYFEDAWTAVHG